jgi:hypothetical protein
VQWLRRLRVAHVVAFVAQTLAVAIGRMPRPITVVVVARTPRVGITRVAAVTIRTSPRS